MIDPRVKPGGDTDYVAQSGLTQPTVPTRSGRLSHSAAIQLATPNSAASSLVRPSNCNPSGRPSSASTGMVSAGQPSSDAETFIAVLPVVPRPTGAAPQAPAVMNASYFAAA